MTDDLPNEQQALGEVALIAQAQRDPAAFGPLYDAHVDAIYRYIVHRLGPGPDAEDLTGVVFLRALRALPSYRAQGVPFRHWLYRIAGNAVRDYWRRQRHGVPLDDAEHEVAAIAADGQPDEWAEEQDLHARLRQYVRQLPASQQEAVVLRFGHELSYAEIAAVLGKTENATRQLVHRALTALRNKIGGDADGLI